MIAEELVTLLRYKVDNSGLSRFKTGMKGVSVQAGGMVNRMRSVGVATRKGLVGGLRQGVIQHKALNVVQSRAIQNTRQIGAGYSRLSGYIKLALGAFSVKKIFGYIDSWGQMEARMKQATASAQEYAEVDADLARVSRLTYKSYSDNAELFVRIRSTMADLGKTTQDTVDVTEALSLGMVLSSTSTANTDNVITQFTKAVMNGKLQMEQYQSLMSQAPRLQTALADGLGVSTIKLLEMVKAGKVTTEKMLPALNSQLAKMRIEAEDMPVTMTDAFTVLNDALQRFFGRTLTAGRWAVLGVTRSIEYLADNIETVIGLIALAGATFIWARVSVAIGAATKTAGSLIGALRAMRIAAWASLGPYLAIAAAIAVIYLVGQDAWTWLQGGDSILGDIIGKVGSWKTQMDAVSHSLSVVWMAIQDLFSAVSSMLVEFINWELKLYGIEGSFKDIKDVAEAVFASILAGAVFALDQISSLIKGITALFRGEWDKAGKHFENVLKGMAKPLIWLKDKAIGVMKAIGSAIGTYITNKIAAFGGMVRSLLPESGPVQGLGGSMFNPLNDSVNRRLGNAATKQPQSYMPGSQNNKVENNVTINAQTNSPAALANAAGNAVGESTGRALDRTRRSWIAPNVEVAA